MKILVDRREFTHSSTMCELSVDGKFVCYTLEDCDRYLETGGVKVPHATAIPRGTYKVVYWAVEPDPLTVTYVGSDQSTCKDRKYTFKRLVRSDKDLDIYVQERWHAMDGSMDMDGFKGELVVAKPIHYPLGKGFMQPMEFDKAIPKVLPKGKYEYRPYATYKVNPLKTITKKLPMQIVDVICDYDKDKHGAME